jgi:hypothetical protein
LAENECVRDAIYPPGALYPNFCPYIIRINSGTARRIDAAPPNLLQCGKSAPAHAVLLSLVFGPASASAFFMKNNGHLPSPLGRHTACALAWTGRHEVLSRAIKRLALVMCAAHAVAE